MKNVLPGKKTYISLALTAALLLASIFLPGDVDADEARDMADQVETLWPQVLALFTTALAWWGRAVAKPT